MYFNIYLSNYERIKVITSTFIFLIMILLIKPMILGKIPNTKQVIVFTLLFFIWYSLSLGLTNGVSYNKVKKDLKVN